MNIWGKLREVNPRKLEEIRLKYWLNFDPDLFENSVFEDWIGVSIQGNVLEIKHSHFWREFPDFIVFQVENLETSQLEDVSVDGRDFVIWENQVLFIREMLYS